jgi:hypothetical protein
VGNGTGGQRRRVTSGQREMVAAWLRTEAMDFDLAEAWTLADACAVLVDAGWLHAVRVLLRHYLNERTAGRAWSVLVGGMPPADELMLRRGRRRGIVILPPDLPTWATYGLWSGPAGEGPALYGRELLDLRASAGEDRPHVRVLVFGTDEEPPSVAVEVSEAGTPVMIEPAEARQFSLALTNAAQLVEAVRDDEEPLR